MTTPVKQYVLGTGDDELQRLGLQHRLWSDAAHSLWRRARIQVGHRVLDVGSGPGYAAFDLAQLVTDAGRVVGVDESSAFIEWLNSQAAARGLGQLSGVVGDVQRLGELSLGGGELFDLAYCRWVLCFVPDPEAVVRGVAARLRQGGRWCIHDYFNYGSMTAAPRRSSHDKAVAATIASWKARGGDPDIMGRLPMMLERNGFRVTHLDVHQRLARGAAGGEAESMFTWVQVWWRIFAPKLVQMGRLDQADCDELLRDLDEIRQQPDQFISVPPVYEIIAERV